MFVLALIILPIILFSTLNPYPNTDPPTGGVLNLEIQVTTDSSATSAYVESYTLFTTQHVTKLHQLNSTEFDAVNF